LSFRINSSSARNSAVESAPPDTPTITVALSVGSASPFPAARRNLDLHFHRGRPWVRIKRFLRETYGGRRWRKLKGDVVVRFDDGRIRRAEVHWYEAHGIGKREFKIKLPFLD